MSVSDVVAMAACGAITGVVIVLAWVAGRHAGYWARVQEEKDARGMR